MNTVQLDVHTGATDDWAEWRSAVVPVLRSTGDHNLVCGECNTLLVDGAHLDQLLDLSDQVPDMRSTLSNGATTAWATTCRTRSRGVSAGQIPTRDNAHRELPGSADDDWLPGS